MAQSVGAIQPQQVAGQLRTMADLIRVWLRGSTGLSGDSNSIDIMLLTLSVCAFCQRVHSRG